MLEHDTNLVLTAFDKADLVPRVVAFFDELETGWSSFAAVHRNTAAERFFFVVRERTFHFYKVGFGDMAGR